MKEEKQVLERELLHLCESENPLILIRESPLLLQNWGIISIFLPDQASVLCAGRLLRFPVAGENAHSCLKQNIYFLRIGSCYDPFSKCLVINNIMIVVLL